MSVEYNRQADAALKAHDTEEVVRLLELSVAYDNDNWNSYYKLGLTYFYLKEYSKATERFLQIVERAPESAGILPNAKFDVYHLIGLSFAYLGDISKAVPNTKIAAGVQGEEYYERLLFAEMHLAALDYGAAEADVNDYLRQIQGEG